LYYVDVAVIVFNNCTSDNNGKTVPIQGGEVTVTQDSPNFEVTFDYEFLEDFRKKVTQQWQHSISDSDVYKPPDTDTLTTASDEFDGM